MTGNNFQKTPLGPSLARIAQQKVLDELQKTGRELPCSVVSASGSIVTVKFEVNSTTGPLPQITIPVAGSKYVRVPYQTGDMGVVQAGDVYLGGVSGLGGGTAGLTKPFNFTALFFVPLGNVSFSADANNLVLQGPTGAKMGDLGGAAVISATTSGITMSFGGHTLSITNAGITLDGILWDTHVHGGVSPGASDTGPPL